MLTLISYNIRYDNPKDGVNAWENRKQNVVALLKTQNPDVFCVQEVTQTQKDYLETQFPDFGLVGVGRADGWLGGEMVNIFYAKNRLEKISNGDFWLSDTPDIIGSCTWGNRLPRLASWICLWDKVEERTFFVFNTHFDHESLEARQKSATLIYQKINEIAGENLAFLTGDFNLTPSENTYKMLASCFSDLCHIAPISPKQITTFNNFGARGVSNMWIDYIFCNQKTNLQVESFEVIDTKIDNRFPSDHFPLVVKIG